ncbi:helix-turn-helix domain-containing protein [Natrinema soli]|uniref:AlbA family DNA-binding domain-containing protein n=1 Tax=Natrinema soli TaxID=1930624 RepID=UPI00235F683F|nr:ATP-binding protein [Natrinema soli]
MLSSDLEDISAEDLERLIEIGVPERTELEFKYMLDPGREGHKKNLVKEVTSFANTSGGDLLIGIPDPDDVDHLGLSLNWITDYTRDEYKLKLEDIIRTGTQPQLSSHEIHTIPNPNQGGAGFVAIVRIQQSMISPHRATNSSGKPFYGRNSAGTYSYDVEQLREQLIEQYRLTEEIESFLADRIAKIRAGNTPAPYETGPSIILHVIPATAFGLQPEVDISPGENEMKGLPLFHRNSSGSHYGRARRNVDGIVNSKDFQRDDEDLWSEYTQLYRDGRIEAVHSFHLRNERVEEDRVGFLTLYEILRDRIPDYLGFLADRKVQTPIFLYMTFIESKGYVLAKGRRNRTDRLDRDVATLPSATVESYDTPYSEIIKDLLQEVWHAFGEFGDPYDTLGEPEDRLSENGRR